MNFGEDPSNRLWPIAVFFICSAAIAGLMIGVSFLLGQKHAGRVTSEPYESGMPVVSSVGLPVSVKYYLVAMSFVVFDVEAVFIYAWAVSARTLGWTGYVGIVIFIVVLLVALLYLSKLGAFAWANPDRKSTGGGGGGMP